MKRGYCRFFLFRFFSRAIGTLASTIIVSVRDSPLQSIVRYSTFERVFLLFSCPRQAEVVELVRAVSPKIYGSV